MAVNWRLNQQQREAQAKREQLAALNARIERLDAMLAEAQDFEGYFNDRLAVAERRIAEVAQVGNFNSTFPYWRHPDHPAEYERRRGERAEIERERAEERARRTTTSSDGFHTLTFCALDPGDVIGQRSRVIITRDQVARELADIEAQMTAGELVESGVPATEYTEHRGRVAALRARLGMGGAS